MADRFRTTRWSAVLAAGRGGDGSREALAWLCETYWYPLYAYVRRRGHSTEDAQDLTQSFFVDLLDRDSLQGLDPKFGRFRAFLLASIKNFLSTHRERMGALKRRANDRAFQVDLDDAERRYTLEADGSLDPEQLFESRWARSVLDRVLRRLEEEYAVSGRGETFRILQCHLTGDEPPYEQLTAKLQTTPGAVRVAVHRLRRRLGALLREEVAQTLADPADVDFELRSLLAAAGRES